MNPDKEQPAVEEETGLDVDLGKVFDEVTQEDTPEEAVAEQPKETPKQETKEPEVQETPPEPEATEEPVKETPQEEPSDEAVPPATWTAEAKEMFSGLDPVLQQEVLKREKDYAQGIQKHADAAKTADAYEQVIAPYKAMIAAEGSNPVQAIASLFNTAYQLRSGTPEQKAQLILQLANQYGADLSQVTPSQDEDEYVDPEIKSLKDEISSLKQTTQSQMQAAQNQQLVSLQQQIDAFSKDPKNVHFEKVQSTMSSLLTSGGATTLEEAYDKSLYLVPEIRESIIQEQVKEAEAARVKKESEAAAKAKKAAGVQLQNEEGAGTVTATDGTMEEELAAAYDKANAS
jgi:hypothetical protein